MKFKPENIKTLVVKIGTNLLQGRLAFEGQVMEAVVRELCQLKKQHDLNVLIVSSGAVGCGMTTLGMTTRPTDLPLKQATAAVGQATLMHYYETLFRTYGDGLNSAQVLLTQQDLNNRQSYLNVRNTLQALFDMRTIVPVLNENDSTATEQLRFGDNDTLAAKIASKINSGLLIILSDVDGLYDKNPARFEDAQLIEELDAITPEIELMAEGAGSISSTGGMRTKLEGARIATAAGVPVVIANGHRKGIIHGVLEGNVPCTLFTPCPLALPHRKRWIAFGRSTQGTLHVDAGAEEAIRVGGKSLLPAGVVRVEGVFEPGAAVKIVGPNCVPIGRALVNYSSAEITQIMGRKSNEIEAIIGHRDYDELVHRDNLVLF